MINKQNIAKNWKVLSAAVFLTSVLVVGSEYFQGVIAQTDTSTTSTTSPQTATLIDGKASPSQDINAQVAVPLPVRHTRPGNITFLQGSDFLVPLTAGGATQSSTFQTSGKLLVTYTAECAVAARTSTATWLNIDIKLVNLDTGAVITLSPTSGTSDAFCTSNGTPSADGWVMTSISGVATGLTFHNYAVKIVANVQNGVSGDFGWLGDTSINISK